MKAEPTKDELCRYCNKPKAEHIRRFRGKTYFCVKDSFLIGVFEPFVWREGETIQDGLMRLNETPLKPKPRKLKGD